jgi:hypothetical protein
MARGRGLGYARWQVGWGAGHATERWDGPGEEEGALDRAKWLGKGARAGWAAAAMPRDGLGWPSGPGRGRGERGGPGRGWADTGREREKKESWASLLSFYILLFSLPFLFPTTSN